MSAFQGFFFWGISGLHCTYAVNVLSLSFPLLSPTQKKKYVKKKKAAKERPSCWIRKLIPPPPSHTPSGGGEGEGEGERESSSASTVLSGFYCAPNRQRTLDRLPAELLRRNFVNKHRLSMQVGGKRAKTCVQRVRVPTELQFCVPPLVVGQESAGTRTSRNSCKEKETEVQIAVMLIERLID